MKNFTYSFIIVSIAFFTSCTKDSEPLFNEPNADLITNLSFCNDNYTLNYLNGNYNADYVDLLYDYEYDSNIPPQLITHVIQFKTIDGTYSFSESRLQISQNINYQISKSELNDNKVGQWRVRLKSGEGSIKCDWSDWIDYNPFSL